MYLLPTSRPLCSRIDASLNDTTPSRTSLNNTTPSRTSLNNTTPSRTSLHTTTFPSKTLSLPSPLPLLPTELLVRILECAGRFAERWRLASSLIDVCSSVRAATTSWLESVPTLVLDEICCLSEDRNGEKGLVL